MFLNYPSINPNNPAYYLLQSSPTGGSSQTLNISFTSGQTQVINFATAYQLDSVSPLVSAGLWYTELNAYVGTIGQEFDIRIKVEAATGVSQSPVQLGISSPVLITSSTPSIKSFNTVVSSLDDISSNGYATLIIEATNKLASPATLNLQFLGTTYSYAATTLSQYFPQGPQGFQGSTGPQGFQGSTGPQPSLLTADQQVVFNSSGSATGNSGLVYNYSTNTLISNAVTTGDLIVGNATIHIGTGSGFSGQTANSIAIGRNAGQSGQGNSIASSIAIGYGAGQTSQNYNSIAIGESAGSSTQGLQSIAIGPSAGSNTQGNQSISIGYQAGQTSQSANAIAIGMAGKNNQSTYSVAIGVNCGQQSLGTSSVAIGYKAAESTGVANSIILNASGNTLNATTSGLFVNPVRVQNGIPTGVLGYNNSTSEVAVTNVLPNMSLTGTTQVYGNLGMNNYQIQNPVLKGVNEYVYVSTGVNTSYTVNCATGNNFNLTLSGNTVFNFINWPVTNTLQSVNLFLTQPSSGVTFYTGAFSGVSFGNQASYVSFSTGTNLTDVYSFFSYNNGGKILGFLSGKGF